MEHTLTSLGSGYGFSTENFDRSFSIGVDRQDSEGAQFNFGPDDVWSARNSSNVGRENPTLKYEFRPAVRTSQPAFCTWVDEDPSGDFDPSCKRNQPKITPEKRRYRPVYEDNSSEESIAKKQKVYTWQLGRRTGSSFPITLRLASDAGHTLLSNLGTSSDYWPSPQWVDQFFEPDLTELNIDAVQPHRLRTREANGFRGTRSQPDLPCFLHNELTLGHPAARGCKSCAEIDLHCSLLQEGEKYPCIACCEDENDCELVIPPVHKRACARCHRRRIVCSYRVTEDHSGPCKDCASSDQKCIAGPRSGRTRTGPCLDQDPASLALLLKSPERLYKSCTQCRESKTRCSLLSKPGFSNCSRCEDNGVDCTFNTVQTRPRRIAKKHPEGLPQQGPLKAPKISASSTKLIKTRLPHPIRFNYMDPEDGSVPCSWCNDLTYGLLGLGRVNVEVADYHDGQGYLEIRGGHVGRGAEPSRMCQECTLTRLEIVACGEHQMTMLEGVDTDTLDPDYVDGFLLLGVASQATFEWCSVCPTIASYGCAKPKTVGPVQNLSEEDDDEVLGCGLLLCEDCRKRMASDYCGSLTTMITDMEDDEEIHDFALRADANFLRSDGHLVSRIYGS